MHDLKPKEQHELILANADKEQIVLHMNSGQDEEVTRIAITLARQCGLYVHFARLWRMRVSDLDGSFGSDDYMKNLYTNRRLLHKELIKTRPS